MLAVRWHLRYALSYRDLEEVLAESGIDVDHVTLFRWVQRFTPELIDAARPGRYQVGARWFVDETYMKVAGAWRFFTTALAAHRPPVEVITDRAAVLANVIRGHAFIQNLRHGHYELGIDTVPIYRLATAFDELQLAI